MKTEFYAIGPLGLGCVFISGFLIANSETLGIAFGILLMVAAREDLVRPFSSGTYQRNWFLWRLNDVAREDTGTGKIVPFKGPAA